MKEYQLICTLCNSVFTHKNKCKKYCSPECLKKISKERMKKIWKDENFRNKIKATAQTPESNKRHQDGANKRWEKTEQREIARQNSIKQWSDPKQREGARQRALSQFHGHPEKHPMYGRTGEKAPMFGVHRYGKDAPGYKEGKTLKGGYVMIFLPENNMADNHGYVAEHRLVAEQCLGRYLTSEEVVHHINGIKTDNRPENLYVFENNSKHTEFHHNKYFIVSNLI